MTAPNPGYVRMYNSRRAWTEDVAKQLVKRLAQDVETLRLDLEKGNKTFASQGRALADAAVKLTERLAALEAFDEMSYLTTDPDAKEA